MPLSTASDLALASPPTSPRAPATRPDAPAHSSGPGAPSPDAAAHRVATLTEAVGRVVRGKDHEVSRLVLAVLAGGHVLLEDVPGVGKTTLAKALAKALGLEFRRVQFTPDLLPSDILGSSVLDPRSGSLTFQPGPIFTQLLLADEVNRASPRTQSALLEAMNEGQVTVDGATHPLPTPFLVIATQNPSDHHGTFPLPEAQLDRFLMRSTLGYPDEDAEVAILLDRREQEPLDALEPLLAPGELRALQAATRRVAVSAPVARYIVRLARASRHHAELARGVSPRAALALTRAAQARALVEGRAWVGPSDVQALAREVLAHRLVPSHEALHRGRTAGELIATLLAQVPVPT